MNRRGHIGTALIPVLALILVVNALFVMNGFNEGLGKARAEIRAVNSKALAEHKLIEQNVNASVWASIAIASSGGESNKNFDNSFKKALSDVINQQRNSGINTNVYAKLANGEYSLKIDGKNYVLIVSEVFDKTVLGVNEVTRFYSLKVVFDKSKLISIEEI